MMFGTHGIGESRDIDDDDGTVLVGVHLGDPGHAVLQAARETTVTWPLRATVRLSNAVAMDMGAFWDALGVRERGLLVKSGRRRSFRRGDRLCREGDRSTTVLVLLTGHVRILTLAPDGREVVVGVRGAGDVVGDIAAVDHRPRSA